MEFIFYNNCEKFWNENKKLILEKEWLNNLMVSNSLYGIENGIDENWILAKIINNGKTELILLQRFPWKLLLYSPTNNVSEELYKFAAEEIFKINKNLVGVNSENKIANIFSKYYCELSGQTAELHLPMRILVLEKLAENKCRKDIIFRNPEEKDKNILLKFFRDFNIEALGKSPSDDEIIEKINKFLGKNYFILEKNGKIVSQVLSNKQLVNGMSVNGVYTPPEERGKGYAYTVVYLFSKYLLENGAEYCVLFTDDTNPISNHVYEKIGYERRADVCEIDFI